MSIVPNLSQRSSDLLSFQEDLSKPSKHKLLRPALTTSRGVLYHTDCLRLFGALRSDSIDSIFADPPFNLGKDYGNGSRPDALTKSDYLTWCRTWLKECVRALKPGGSAFIYILPQWGYHFAVELESLGMEFRHWIALSMKGTFPRGNKLYPAHYAILYFSKGRPKCFNKIRLPIPTCRHCGGDVKDYGGHRKYLNPLGLNLTDFWEDTAPARHQKFKSRWHINELKPAIPSRCIEMSTNVGDIILDPFGGGGSTFEAAEKLDRNWIGSEVGSCLPIQERIGRSLLTSRKALPTELRSVFKNADARLRLNLIADAKNH